MDAHYFDESPQGVTTYIRNLYISVSKVMPAVEIIFCAYSDRIYKDYPDLKEISRLEIIRNRGTLFRMIIDLPKLAKNHRVDYVHTQYLMPVNSVGKKIVTIHDVLFLRFPGDYPFVHRFLRNLLFRLSAKKCDILVTVSKYSKLEISNFFDINDSSILVTPCGVPKLESVQAKTESKSFVRQRFGIDEEYVLYVSRFEPRKNHISLAKAFFKSKAYEEKFKLVFVGARSISVLEYDNFIGGLSEVDQLKVVELVDVCDEELSHLYRAASVFVYPSLSEGFGIPPLEAATYLIPTVCSNLTAMNDFKFFGDRHINPTCVEKLQVAIDEALSIVSVDELVEIREKVYSQYSWERSATLFVERLKEVV